jgi:mannose/cellobiose epimerase-like protein (N-acyl-D-glucosamine 2-epimerase family)
MLLEELHEYFGSYSHMSRELGLNSSTYLEWRNKGYIPFTTQLVIEKRSDGVFKALEEHGKPPKPSKKLKRKYEEQTIIS